MSNLEAWRALGETIKVDEKQRLDALAEVDQLRSRLSQLAEAGTGYSQATLDAVVSEREQLHRQLADERVKTKQLTERLDSSLNTGHANLAELQLARENLSFFRQQIRALDAECEGMRSELADEQARAKVLRDRMQTIRQLGSLEGIYRACNKALDAADAIGTPDAVQQAHDRGMEAMEFKREPEPATERRPRQTYVPTCPECGDECFAPNVAQRKDCPSTIWWCMEFGHWVGDSNQVVWKVVDKYTPGQAREEVPDGE